MSRLGGRRSATYWGASVVFSAFVVSGAWYHARGIQFDVSTIPLLCAGRAPEGAGRAQRSRRKPERSPSPSARPV